MINKLLTELSDYAITNNQIKPADKIYCINRALNFLKLAEFSEELYTKHTNIAELLDDVFAFAASNNLTNATTITEQDIFTSELINCFVMQPSQLESIFNDLYKNDKKSATDFYYNFSKSTNYIMTQRVKKDIKWQTSTKYGDLIITINLSKPEKDPKEIAKAKLIPQSGYPKCLLCKENEGLCGTLTKPPRANHRIIPITLNNENWFFQYSPYVYYNEHCILLNSEHVPMKINKAAFSKLIDFVDKFPHYFAGSNADLPIVGGSILSHEHFQGGSFDFPMALSPNIKEYSIKNYSDVSVYKVKWALSTIRLVSKNKQSIVELASHILENFREYTDTTVGVLAHTSEPHNTITPIARTRDGNFELDLILRNNRTTSEHPLGIFHPHNQYHNIKKENIGLIEAMGLAVLPARLKTELTTIASVLSGALDESTIINDLPIHTDFYKQLKSENICTLEGVYKKVGVIFSEILENCGIFKDDEQGNVAFDRFISSLS